MHVESFHRILKYQYLDGRVNKRVDRCIEALLSFAEDQMVQMGRRQLWRSPYFHGDEISKRHATAAEMLAAGSVRAIPIDDAIEPTWQVGHWNVSRLHLQCPDPMWCERRCRECGNVCVHLFTCECPDWVQHKGLCKHIHAVCLQSQAAVQVPDVPPPDVTEALPPPSDGDSAGGLSRLCARLDDASRRIGSLPASTPPATVALLSGKVRELEQLLSCTPTSPTITQLQPAQRERPWNAKIVPQPSFVSGRAKRSRAQAAVRADSLAARGLVGELSRGDAGTERRPDQHADHSYS